MIVLHTTYYDGVACVVFELETPLGLAFYCGFCRIWTGLCTNRFKPVCGTRAQNATVRFVFLRPKSNGAVRGQNATVRRVFLCGGAIGAPRFRGCRRGRGRPARRRGGRPAPRGRGRRGTSGRRC